MVGYNEISKDVEEISKEVSGILRSTAEDVIGKKESTSSRKAVPWWNEECSIAVAHRNREIKKAKKRLKFKDYINYKRAQAMVRRVIRTAKRTHWREFCNRIGEEIDINDLWAMIRKMGGIQRNYNIPVLVNNDKIAVSDKEKAKMLVETFVMVHSMNISDSMRKHREEKVRENIDIFDKRNETGSTLELDFTLYELKRAIAGVKQTSPGKDGI